MIKTFDVDRCRRQFPALSRTVAGRPAVFMDGPAGSQVPQAVADAVSGYLLGLNANSGGAFVTSDETTALLQRAHRAVADFLGTDDAELVAFGANMTTLTLALARALARTWRPGDEVIVTRLEHDANFTPWVQAAADSGARVVEVDFNHEDCTLDLGDLESKLSEKTVWVALGAASNAVGTINPVRRVSEMAHAVGAQVFVDAVHYAPHGLIDVADWGCDFVTCSSYKFFGPHVGMLWGRRELLETLPAYKLRPVSDRVPDRWMTGTQNHEGIAGTLAAIDYLADLGREPGDGSDRRTALRAAFETIVEYERSLARRMIDGLQQIDGVKIWGITDPRQLDQRVPTVSITHAEHSPREIATRLGRQGIFVWDGNYYAVAVTGALGLEPDGMVRVGLLHYNTAEEVDRLLEAIRGL